MGPGNAGGLIDKPRPGASEGPGSGPKRTIVFLLVPNFSMIAFATAIEPLRIANRVVGRVEPLVLHAEQATGPRGGARLQCDGTRVRVGGRAEEVERRAA